MPDSFKMPDYFRFPLVMLVVTLVSATTLALIHQVAEPKIEAQKRKNEEEAEKIVFPEGGEMVEKEAGSGKEKFVYKEVRKGGKVVGYIAKGKAHGYSSTIEVLVGLNPDFSVKGVKVLFQRETPGLGTKVEEVESDKTWVKILTGKCSFGAEPGAKPPVAWFTEQYRGLKPDEVRLKSEGGKVDGITGSTISSRGVTNAVRDAIEKVRRAVKGG